MMIENLQLLYSCFNQFVFQSAKDNIKDLQYYFDTNPNTTGNRLVDNLLDAIKTYDLQSIGAPLFQSILMKSGKNQQEVDKIMGEILKYKQCTEEQMKPTKKLIRDISADIAIQKGSKLYQDHPSDYVNYIKSLDLKTSDSDIQLTSTKFGSLDLNTMMADGQMSGIPSKFDFINDTFKPESKYNRTGLNLICMPPGTGKTLFAMQECLNMALLGHKTHYLCMGDMMEIDFITRMGAMFYGIPFYKAKENIGKVYEGLKKAIKDNIDITVIPANEITVDEYVDFVKDKPYDACFIDYDSQFKSKVFTDSMYLVYGEIYSKLSELSIQYKKLVFILAQPMKASWQIPISGATINIDQVGESSRKIHAVDWAITRTREYNNLNGLGVFKIVKSRRGEENVVAYSIRLSNGRFKILPRGVYQQIQQIDEKREFLESEIDAMVASFNQALSSTQSMINNAMMPPPPNKCVQKGPSPFNNNK